MLVCRADFICPVYCAKNLTYVLLYTLSHISWAISTYLYPIAYKIKDTCPSRSYTRVPIPSHSQKEKRKLKSSPPHALTIFIVPCSFVPLSFVCSSLSVIVTLSHSVLLHRKQFTFIQLLCMHNKLKYT